MLHSVNGAETEGTILCIATQKSHGVQWCLLSGKMCRGLQPETKRIAMYVLDIVTLF